MPVKKLPVCRPSAYPYQPPTELQGDPAGLIQLGKRLSQALTQAGSTTETLRSQVIAASHNDIQSLLFGVGELLLAKIGRATFIGFLDLMLALVWSMLLIGLLQQLVAVQYFPLHNSLENANGVQNETGTYFIEFGFAVFLVLHFSENLVIFEPKSVALWLDSKR